MNNNDKDASDNEICPFQFARCLQLGLIASCEESQCVIRLSQKLLIQSSASPDWFSKLIPSVRSMIFHLAVRFGHTSRSKISFFYLIGPISAFVHTYRRPGSAFSPRPSVREQDSLDGDIVVVIVPRREHDIRSGDVRKCIRGVFRSWNVVSTKIKPYDKVFLFDRFSVEILDHQQCTETCSVPFRNPRVGFPED